MPVNQPYQNGSDKSPTITLSNGNLTATTSGVSGQTHNGVRGASTLAHSTGKWYYEGTNTNGFYLGQATASFVLSNTLGADAYGVCITNAGTASYNASYQFSWTPTYNAGDIIQIAFDIGAGSIWFGRNGTQNGDPVGETGAAFTGLPAGTQYPCLCFYSNANGKTLTADFGASAFAYAIPSGYQGLTTSTYSLTGSVNDGSMGSISPSGTTVVSSGVSQSYTITPNTGYQIDHLSVDGGTVAAASSYTFSNVQASHTIEAFFSAITYTITSSVDSSSHGAIIPSGSTIVSYDGSQSYTIDSSAGYAISNVTIDGSTNVGSTSSYLFTNVLANHTIEAFFAASYTLQTIQNDSTEGTITPTGPLQVGSGANQSFSIASNTIGSAIYTILNVSLDGTNLGDVSTVNLTNITANHTIDVTFGLYGQDISASCPDNSFGYLTPSGNISVSQSANQDITFVPWDDCTVDNVIVDGTSLGGNIYSYDFSNVTSGHIVQVYFKNTCYQVIMKDNTSYPVSNTNQLDVNMLYHLRNVTTADATSATNWTDITSYDFTWDNLGSSLDGTHIQVQIFNTDFSNFQIEFITG